MNKAIVLVGFARCGVTLLNRYLASDTRLVCLSEINSRYICPTPPNTIHDQLNAWYGINIDKGTVVDELSSISKWCDANDKQLLIRDWSFGSFVPLKYNTFNPPITLNTIDDLRDALGMEVVPFALVRNPIDVWLSMRDSAKTFHDDTLHHYTAFVNDVILRNIPIFKYEELCQNEDAVIENIYQLMGMGAPKKLTLSANVIGDINYPEHSRGVVYSRAHILKRRGLSESEISFMRNNTQTNMILETLAYTERI